MKFLLLGHAQHGKDSAAEIMRSYWGVTWQSSSVAALKLYMFKILQGLFGYETLKEAYEDRHNHRLLWKELITAYNYNDRARLCRDILEINGNDMYIGMRCPLEYEASKPLFSKIFWIDASQRVASDPSMGIPFDESMIVIDNNGDLRDLKDQIQHPAMGIHLGRW